MLAGPAHGCPRSPNGKRRRKLASRSGSDNVAAKLATHALRKLPTMFFIDKNGIIVKHFVNFQEEPVLEAAIQAAMGK